MKIAERLVRDLCWAVNSPSLLGASELLDRSANASIATWHLEPGDIDRDHLCHDLSKRFPKRTGHYFERLVLYWLRYVRGCQLIAHSLQIRDGKRTVGEIDLLFRDEDHRVTHWELAVKFYLLVATGETEVDYIGPNSHDTLERKVKRLGEHQLPLSERYIPDVEVRQAFVKGMIFYPWHVPRRQSNRTQSHPNERRSSLLAADHLRGQWLWLRDVPTVLTTDQLHCRVLEKPFWLSHGTVDPSDQPMLSPIESIRYLEEHFRSNQSPVLMTASRFSSAQRLETISLFVVPDHWPKPKVQGA